MRNEQINYIDRLAEAIDQELGPDHGCDWLLLRVYALLALVRGANTTERDVHDAWATWRATDQPMHRSLVPFHQLPPDVQALDEPYAKAIRRAARHIRATR